MITAYGPLRECVEVSRRHGLGRNEIANFAQMIQAKAMVFKGFGAEDPAARRPRRRGPATSPPGESIASTTPAHCGVVDGGGGSHEIGRSAPTSQVAARA
jgi:hypothetical protein